jgi:cytochrome c-type biogenesis protein CcmE
MREMNQFRRSRRAGAFAWSLGSVMLGTTVVVGFGAMVAAFLGNASPYVTVQEAKQQSGDNLHLAGDIVPGTLKVSAPSQTVSFMVRDEKGDTLPVVYRGAQPSNMGAATKVVAVGGHKSGIFEARKLLLKCPSKYEGS